MIIVEDIQVFPLTLGPLIGHPHSRVVGERFLLQPGNKPSPLGIGYTCMLNLVSNSEYKVTARLHSDTHPSLLDYLVTDYTMV